MPKIKDTRTKAEIARGNAFALKVLRDKSFSKSYRKAAFQDYKASGGKLTLRQIQAKKPTTKRKGC